MLNGKQLKIKRIEIDMKADELAKLIDVSNGYISQVENGKKSLSKIRYEQWINILNDKQEEYYATNK